MHRSVLLLLISVFVLSAASAPPASLEESLEEDSQQELKAESVEKVDSIELSKASDSSSEEQQDAAKDEVEVYIKPLSSEEDTQEEHSVEVAPRRRRSAEQEKYRNLELLATICPKKDFKDLEESPLISVRIEIEDMYAVCAKLKDRQS